VLSTETHSGAYEGFCLGGGAQFTRVSAPQNFFGPPLDNIGPPP